jgi:hypothetical protein
MEEFIKEFIPQKFVDQLAPYGSITSEEVI